jgi:hypothetical protein
MLRTSTDAGPGQLRTVAPDPTPADTELYSLARAQIHHEDNLITQRLSWLIASQSFLFTASAITLNAPATPRSALFESQQQVLAALIPLVASTICALILMTILAGVAAMAGVRSRLASLIPSSHLHRYPDVQGSAITRRFGLCGPVLLPALFIGVWMVLWARWMVGVH